MSTTNFEKLQIPLSTKIQALHLEKLAIVYIRQSSISQINKNPESTSLQYGLKNRLLQWGWSKERIEVIDEDLGCSGSTIDGRPGFQKSVESCTRTLQRG